jgi:hypothetical protein
MEIKPKATQLRPRRRRRSSDTPTAGWGMMAEAAQRLGFWPSLLAQAARRAFAIACHRLVPRLEPQARAESLDADGRTLVVRVSSSAVASELVYVKDLLLSQVNAELSRLASAPPVGKRSAKPQIERLSYRVAMVKGLPDYAAWVAEEEPPPILTVPPVPWDLEVAAELRRVPDEGTRDALAALYAAATQPVPPPAKRARSPRR